MEEITLVDDFGRRHQFLGEELVSTHTDTSDGRKPQWMEVDVWRTVAGNYVVRRTTCYRIRHTDPDCSRLEGYVARAAGEGDSYPCRSCNPGGVLAGEGYAPSDRITVDAYRTPEALISSFETDGRYTNLARAILADLSEQDARVDARWNTVVVP